MLTETLVLCPALSLSVMLHVPAATGVIVYVAEPAPVEATATLAISPVYGLHVSLSVNAPV